MKTSEEFNNDNIADNEPEEAVCKAHSENRLSEIPTEHAASGTEEFNAISEKTNTPNEFSDDKLVIAAGGATEIISSDIACIKEQAFCEAKVGSIITNNSTGESYRVLAYRVSGNSLIFILSNVNNGQMTEIDVQQLLYGIHNGMYVVKKQ